MLTEEDKELLASFFNLRSIKMLYCGLASFENVPRLSFVRELDLSGNKISSFKGLLCFRYLKVGREKESVWLRTQAFGNGGADMSCCCSSNPEAFATLTFSLSSCLRSRAAGGLAAPHHATK